MEAIFTIKLSSLKPWENDETGGESEFANNDNERQQFKFCVSTSLNRKIYLCQGGISQLALDCIVLPLNEMTLTQSPLSREVHQAAGSSLADYYKLLTDTKTGNVVLGSGFDLPSRYIIHAMEPGMNVKFKSAVENALHRCYRSAMQMAQENKLKTIGFVSLYENVTYIMNEEMAHTALGTVRCFLEKHKDDFEAVVFSVGKNDVDLYLKLLPAYFPRSYSEASESSYLLAMRNLGEWGDKVVVDRAIRISHIPLCETVSLNDADDTTSLTDDDGCVSDTAVVGSGKSSFSSMAGDHDATRMKQMRTMDEQKVKLTRQRVYRRLLRLAHTEELAEIASTNFLSVCGCDRQGDAVAVVVANRINIAQMNTDQTILFFIRTLDPIVNKKYSLVYFHTMSLSKNQPSLSLIKRVYNVLDSRYKENLKRFYMVHPSITSRVFTWFFATFSASAVKRQILTVKNIPELYKHIAPDQIDIPPFVSDYDLKVNLQVYQKKVVVSMDKQSTADDDL